MNKETALAVAKKYVETGTTVEYLGRRNGLYIFGALNKDLLVTADEPYYIAVNAGGGIRKVIAPLVADLAINSSPFTVLENIYGYYAKAGVL